MSNSHIQVTQGLMKGFNNGSRRNPTVYCLDIQKNAINKVDVRKQGAIQEYFSPEVENYLSHQVEDAFGKTAQKVRDFVNGKTNKKSIPFTHRDRHAVIKFLYFAMLRSRNSLTLANQFSYTVPFLGEISANELIHAMRNTDYTRYHGDKMVSILVNQTEYGFVLPQNCFYLVPSQHLTEEFYDILPITPYIAFMLYPRNEFIRIFSKNGYSHNAISEIYTVRRLNRLAYSFEKHLNNGFLISKSTVELEDLLLSSL